MKRTMMLSAAALAIGFGTAGAQEMGEYDTDGDGYISSAEFAAHSAPEFEGLDADQSGGVTADEYAAAQISRFDQDQDQMLGEGEYNASTFGIDPLRGTIINQEYRAETVGVEALDSMDQEGAAEGGEAAADAGGGEQPQAGVARFGEIDTNQDTLLDRDEYKFSVQDAFDTYDRDQTGELSQEELGQA